MFRDKQKTQNIHVVPTVMKRKLIAICVLLWAVLIPSTTVAIADVNSVPVLWVLHNEDPDYTNPPFDDSLTGVNSSGEVVLRTTGFNICQTIGGNRALALSDADQTVMVCENVGAPYGSEDISKWDYQGNEIFSITLGIENEHSVAVDVRNDGTIYALTNESGGGNRILKISSGGNILAEELMMTGFDLVIDEVLGGIYVVGRDLRYYSYDLGLQWTIDPIGYCATSVDTCSDGTAWVVERDHPSFPSSANRLHHLSHDGTITKTLALDNDSFCVRVDKWDNSIYVASKDLHKYDSEGLLQWSVPLGPPVYPRFGGWSLAIDLDRRGIWVGTYYDVRLISFDGSTLVTLDDFPGVDQKYVACPRTIPGQVATWPAGSSLSASDVGLTSLSLTWTPAIGAYEYLLFQDSNQIATLAGMVTTCDITELDPNTEYTFKVDACDWDGNCTTDGPSATARTLTPAGAIQGLAIQVMTLNLHNGIENSLDGKLDAALQALDDINTNNDVAAINTLEAFINAVEAQRGGWISEADADALIAAAQEIIDLLSAE